MQIIGLTGPTGAGKSAVGVFFEQEGFAVIDCDLVAREVVKSGKPCLLELVDYFGIGILNSDQTLNRKQLANIAFGDSDKRYQLNKITHHHITIQIMETLERFRQSQQPFVVLDAPTLFESGVSQLCDKIVVVIADKELRLNRILARDMIDKKSVLLRMNAQQDESFYTRKADYIIRNEQNEESLKAQVLRICNQLRSNIQF